MKHVVLAAVALSALCVPALAQQTPSGTSAGGPARVGAPGQIGAGVPGAQPNVVEERMNVKKASAPSRPMTRKKKKAIKSR